MARVSVLIPSFNRGPTIGGALQSCLNQTYKDWEAIILDDGSNEEDGFAWIKQKLTKVGDDTATILRRFKDSRIKYHKRKVNLGVAHTRNELMALASGEYCIWLDSDDMSNYTRLELCLKAMDDYGPTYVRSSTTTYANPKDATTTLPPILVWRGGVSFATIMFPRSNLLKFDTEFRVVCEDMDWETRYAAEYGKGMHIPLTLYAIGRRTPGRLTMKYKEEDCLGDVRADKARLKKKQDAAIAKMAKKGYVKKPVAFPWDALEPYMARWYRKKHG
jgi:glycosyltransferase involved in cell wall biosynthesis